MRRTMVSLITAFLLLHGATARAQKVMSPDLVLDGWDPGATADMRQMVANANPFSKAIDYLKNSMDHLLGLKALVGPHALKETAAAIGQGAVLDAVTDKALATPVDDLVAANKYINDYAKAADLIDTLNEPPFPQDVMMIELVRGVRGTTCPSGAKFICNPVGPQKTVCTTGAALMFPGMTQFVTAAFSTECTAAAGNSDVNSISQIAISSLPRAHMTTNPQTGNPAYVGDPYATLCMRCTDMKKGSPPNLLDRFIQFR